jgi:hypothetical protein
LVIKPDYLNEIAAPAAKNVKIASMRITLEALLHKQRKAPEAAPHVRMPCRKPDAHIPRDCEHQRVMASMTVFTNPASATSKIRSRAPLSKSNSMTGERLKIASSGYLRLSGPGDATMAGATSLPSDDAILTGTK